MTDTTPQFTTPANRLQTALPLMVLALLTIVSLSFKLPLLNIGAPYTTIDDNTLFEAAFLVWFGEAPPQRTYIESWLVGISVISTYVFELLNSGQLDQLGINLIADAYRMFSENPTPFVHHYRLLMLALDLATAGLVYALTHQLLQGQITARWAAALAAGLYLLSYNSIWCYLVARPDTATAFFTCLGLVCYYRSAFGQHVGWFCSAALMLGIATGFKLHAAMAVVFIVLDLWRHSGLRQAFAKMLGFASLGFALFLISAGTTLFDPLLYIKLRALNIRDDASPWIQWGDQFLVVVEGTGWLIVPLILLSIYHWLKHRLPGLAFSPEKIPAQIQSAIFISGCFLLVFCSIRQLRAYWMLPALPLFYAIAVYTLSRLPHRALQISLSALLLFVFGYQCLQQSHSFSAARYNEMQTWVGDHVKPNEPIYILGYDTLFLPCNTQCLQNRKRMLEANLNAALNADEPFTQRHVRLWEERARLRLIDMLNGQSKIGFDYYGFNMVTPEIFFAQVPFEKLEWVFIMQDFSRPDIDEIIAQVKNEFDFITRVHAPGGKAGTGGLPYDIYRRKQP